MVAPQGSTASIFAAEADTVSLITATYSFPICSLWNDHSQRHKAQDIFQSCLGFEFGGMADVCCLSFPVKIFNTGKDSKTRCQLYQKSSAVFKGIFFIHLLLHKVNRHISKLQHLWGKLKLCRSPLRGRMWCLAKGSQSR